VNYTTRDDILLKIAATKGKIFSVSFIKRTDGSLRRMVCRTGVTRHLKGTGKSRDPALGLISVFDVARGSGYRSIPKENIIEATIGGQTYKVK